MLMQQLVQSKAKQRITCGMRKAKKMTHGSNSPIPVIGPSSPSLQANHGACGKAMEMMVGVQAVGMEVEMLAEAGAPATGTEVELEMIPGEEMLPGIRVVTGTKILCGLVEAKQAAAVRRLGVRTDIMSYRYVALSVSYRSVPLNCSRCIEALCYG